MKYAIVNLAIVLLPWIASANWGECKALFSLYTLENKAIDQQAIDLSAKALLPKGSSLRDVSLEQGSRFQNYRGNLESHSQAARALLDHLVDIRNRKLQESPGNIYWKMQFLSEELGFLQLRFQGSNLPLARKMAELGRQLLKIANQSIHRTTPQEIERINQDLLYAFQSLAPYLEAKEDFPLTRSPITASIMDSFWGVLNLVTTRPSKLFTQEELLVPAPGYRSFLRSTLDHIAVFIRASYVALAFQLLNPHAWDSVAEVVQSWNVEKIQEKVEDFRQNGNERVKEKKESILSENERIHRELTEISKARKLTEEEKQDLEMAKIFLDIY